MSIYDVLPSDARWYSREDLLAVLGHPQGTKFSARDRKQLASQDQRANSSNVDTQQGAAALAHSDPAAQAREVENNIARGPLAPATSAHDQDPPFRLPPLTAIAGVLIRDWAEDKISARPELSQIQKGNL